MLKVREIYLKKLIDFQDTEFIKVLTGVRRSGKSFILSMFRQHLLDSGIRSEQIVFINFEHPDMDNIKSASSLMEYVKSQANVEGKHYFLFDEIQEVESWQKVVNGLRIAYDADIYITGSNARMLSGELATLLSGRYVEIRVMPLSFIEFCDFKGYHDQSKLYEHYREYLDIGSFPSVALLKNKSLVESVLTGIYDSIILKAVSLRGDIKDISLLLRVVTYLMDQIGNPVSAASIAATLCSSGRKTTNETVDKYLTLLEDAFIIFKAERYDIRGKERLKTLPKYYVVDLGLRNAVLGRNRGNLGAQLENIVYLELVRRNYDVSVGKLNDSEIDFVCRNLYETLYVQVAYEMPKNSQRETQNLLRIPDNYKKVLIVGNPMESGTIDGIDSISILDFLRGTALS